MEVVKLCTIFGRNKKKQNCLSSYVYGCLVLLIPRSLLFVLFYFNLFNVLRQEVPLCASEFLELRWLCAASPYVQSDFSSQSSRCWERNRECSVGYRVSLCAGGKKKKKRKTGNQARMYLGSLRLRFQKEKSGNYQKLVRELREYVVKPTDTELEMLSVYGRDHCPDN